MAFQVADRVKETTTTTGTGTVTLAGAVSGFRSFTSVLSNSDTTYYAIVHQSASEWETGIGTFTTSGTTLARTTVLASSNSNALVNFSSGTKDVFITQPATQSIHLDGLSATPALPPTGDIQLYSRLRAGRPTLNLVTGAGRDYAMQPILAFNKVVMWLPENSTTIRTWGMPITNVGTVSTPTLASTNLATSIRRWRLTSAATANSAAENRAAATLAWRGNASGLGGVTWVANVSFSTLSTNCRGFFGFTSATGATSTSQVPSALTNAVGFQWDATETTLRIGGNDNTGSATRTDLGSNFPTNSTSAVYTMMLFCRPNDDRWRYYIIRDDTGDEAQGELTTDIPTAVTFLAPHLYMNNGGDASAVSFDCGGLYIESDR